MRIEHQNTIKKASSVNLFVSSRRSWFKVYTPYAWPCQSKTGTILIHPSNSSLTMSSMSCRSLLHFSISGWSSRYLLYPVMTLSMMDSRSFCLSFGLGTFHSFWCLHAFWNSDLNIATCEECLGNHSGILLCRKDRTGSQETIICTSVYTAYIWALCLTEWGTRNQWVYKNLRCRSRNC